MKGFVFFTLLWCTTGLYGQFIVDDTDYTIAELVNDVLVDSNCAETSNYTSFTGTAQNINGIAYFNANNTDFPYEEGVILSTGRARDAKGPNLGINDSGDEEWPGDNELRSITGTGNLFNATYIQFDFVPLTNNISFNFLFASEEYQENYQCIYSDVFAFILTDSEGVSTNLAIIPNTDQPVRATTIRPGIEGQCNERNIDFFDKVNDRGSPISFHGQTKSLKAESLVNPGETYTIKLVISDNQDSQVDSAVFLEADSFSLGLDLGQDRTVANGNPACLGETVSLDVSVVKGVQDYRWYKNDIEITEWAGNARIDPMEDGRYDVDLIFSDSCTFSGGLNIEFIAPPDVSASPVDITVCDVDRGGKETFDFFTNGQRILGNQDTSIYQVNYYTSETDALRMENPISDTRNYVADASETIYARISSGNSCFEIVPFQLKIQPLGFESSLKEEYILCLDSTGETIDSAPVLDTGLASSDYTFAWYKEEIAEESRIEGANAPSYTASSIGTYYIVLQNLEYGCEISISTKVMPSQQPNSFEVVMVSDLFTNNNSVDLIAEGNSTYLFSVDDRVFGTENRFENLAAGEHTAYVTDSNNCSVRAKKFLVVDFPRFFTPNGDGVNDTWNIIGFPEIEEAEIGVYDRYGILQYRFDYDDGWDGTVGSKDAPSGDYWFIVSYLKDGLKKEFKSHFALKR